MNFAAYSCYAAYCTHALLPRLECWGAERLSEMVELWSLLRLVAAADGNLLLGIDFLVRLFSGL